MFSFRYLKGDRRCLRALGGPPFFQVPPTKEAPINKLPTSVDELIDELDRLCPEVIPGAAEDMISIQRRAGKRELVVMLKHLRDRRNRPAPVQERKR